MKKQFILASTLFLGMSVTLPAASSAQSTQQITEDQDFYNQVEALDQKLIKQELIKTVDPYIIIKNNKFKLTNIKELKKEISKSELQMVKKQLDEVNQTVGKYDSVKTINKNTIQAVVTDEEIKNKLEESGYDLDSENKIDDESSILYSDRFQISASSNGINKVDWHWWGAEIWLSKTSVTNIMSGGIGATGSALGLLLPTVGAAAIIMLNGWIGGIYAGKYARACKFDYSWVNGPHNFRYQ
jgi:hypothetical protein